MTNVTFGSNASTGTYTDLDIYQSPGVVDIPARRTALNGQGPQIITHLLGYTAGVSATRTVTIKLGSAQVSYSAAVASASVSTGYLNATDWYIANGTNNAVFGYYNSSGSIFAGRATSGGTVLYGSNSYTGVLGGAYSYIQVPVAPGTPTVSVGTSAGTIDVAWTAPSDDGGSAVTGYLLEYSTSPTFASVDLGIDLTGVTSYTANVVPGVTYYFRVAAYNAVTTAASTSSVYSGISAAITAPGSPKTWNGYTWAYAPTKVWNGTTWVTAPTNTWNGTSWVGVN